METTARNEGEKEMPVGFGIHPYFHKPSEGLVHVPAKGRWELSDSLPTGNILPAEGRYDLNNGQNLRDLNLDDIFTFIESDTEGIARCVLKDYDYTTETMVEFPTSQFPHVVVFTPPEPRQAICIEPNTCPTDAFNLQERGVESNLTMLAAGSEMKFNLCIYTRPSDIVSRP